MPIAWVMGINSEIMPSRGVSEPFALTETPLVRVRVNKEKVAIRSGDRRTITIRPPGPLSPIICVASCSRPKIFPSHQVRTFGVTLQTSFSSCALGPPLSRRRLHYRMS